MPNNNTNTSHPEKCCGRCNYHQKVLYGYASQWECINTDSEYCGEERGLHDMCALFDNSRPYVQIPITKR